MPASSTPEERATVEANNLYLCKEPAGQAEACSEYLPLSLFSGFLIISGFLTEWQHY